MIATELLRAAASLLFEYGAEVVPEDVEGLVWLTGDFCVREGGSDLVGVFVGEGLVALVVVVGQEVDVTLAAALLLDDDGQVPVAQVVLGV